MPRRRTYKKKFRKRHKASVGKKATVKLVKEVIQGAAEHKFALAALTAAAQSAAGNVVGFAMPAQGDAINNRDGDTIKFAQIYGDVFIQTKGDLTNISRFSLIQWLPDSSVELPTIAKIFQDSASPWMSPFILNKDARSKFRVLTDHKFMLTNYIGMKHLKVNINPRKLRKVQFLAGATTGKGLVFTVDSCDSVTATRPYISFEMPYKWTDI